jgi:chromate transporter
MRRSRFMSAFLNGVNAGVIAAIGITVARLAGEALQPLNGAAVTSYVAVALAVVAVVALIRFRINATWLIVAGGWVGLALQLLAVSG